MLVFMMIGSFLFAEGSKEVTADTWPQGTVQVIVPAKAGGGYRPDGTYFTDYLQREIGSPVVVVNQPSGGGTVAYEQVRMQNRTDRLFCSTIPV